MSKKVKRHRHLFKPYFGKNRNPLLIGLKDFYICKCGEVKPNA